MTTLNTYKVWRPSDGIFWEIDATTPEQAVTEICGEYIKHLVEITDPFTKEIIYNFETFHYGINGDERFEVTSVVLVTRKETK